ncbi:alpha/beta hydrolase [Kutzneria sp. CA-103260]|uniref:alpha/beta hydrolase n=1 Tax=Kutzneria sp. CA-103260 TaxID=2802641 RepID=UPI0020115CE7|nr:alpha/beta hydrolase [Kutzneria sp. CA-103260]
MKRWLRTLLVLALVVVLAIGGYVAYVAIRSAQPVTLPAPTGVYPIGRVTADWTDRSRTDPLAPRPGTPRQLSVWVWYPAALGPALAPAAYAPGPWAGLHLGGPAGVAETAFDDVHGHAFAEAPIADGRFPVAVLEPGLGFAAPQYTTLAESLASNGYLVVGVTPTYSANLTVLGGEPVSATDAGNPAAFSGPDEHASPAQAAGDRLIEVWAADDRFAAAQAGTLDSAGRFAGHVDATKVVYLGHSFGGAAALEACRTDQHCAGAADLDGTQYGPVVHAGLRKPMLLLSSENSCVTGTCQPTAGADRSSLDTARTLLAASSGPTWCYQLNGAEHFNFSDYGAYYIAAPVRSQLALGTIDGDDALDITNAYLAAFVGQVTSGRPEPLLAGQATPYPQVAVQHTP